MTGFDDDAPEMPPALHLDDATVAAILDGDRPRPALDDLAAFSAGVMAVGDGAPPRRSPELAALLTEGAPSAGAVVRTPRAQRSRSRLASVLAKAAGLGLVAKIGVTTTAAAAGVIGAGAAGVLPGDADVSCATRSRS